MDRKKRVQLVLLSFLCFYAGFTIIADVAHNHPQAPFALNANCTACVQSLTLCCISTAGLGLGLLPETWGVLSLPVTVIFIAAGNSGFLCRAPPLG